MAANSGPVLIVTSSAIWTDMDFGLDETQQLLKNSAADFLDRECPTSHVRAMESDALGYDPALWSKMASQGWMGLALPEEHGGAGLGFVELALLLEETGRVLLPSPFFATAVLAAPAIADGATGGQKREWLPRLAGGSLIATAAIAEPTGGWDAVGIQATARPNGSGFALSGAKLYVPFANAAQLVLVAARLSDTGSIALFAVDKDASGLAITSLKSIGSERISGVVLQDAPGVLLGGPTGGDAVVADLVARGAVGGCSWALGAMQRILDMTIEYAGRRTQFGKPIGSLQAIQHRCADMALDVEMARCLTYAAAQAVVTGGDGGAEAAMAKSFVADASRRVSAAAHQVFGAIGFTKEHDLQLYTRRLKAWEPVFGSAALQRERVAEAMGVSR
ncbi:MAG: acyl-CoA dehydrogenase [SAR202 cluster bacterium]|nr:acyl-CoA dehydrogenase [SAR202 cluster bacterium]